MEALVNKTSVLQKQELEETLEVAFARFREASERLEHKYSELLCETERLREQLHEKDLEVKRAERFAWLGEAAAGLAHEIRNPLGSMKLFLSLLRKDLDGQEAPLGLIDEIGKSMTSLDGVISNILQFARGKKLAFGPVNLHSLVKEQILTVNHYKEQGATFTLNLSSKPFVIGNEAGIRQVLSNLILNALQATRYKGAISVSLLDEVGGGVNLIVKDDGPGIPEEIRESLFEPFVTMKREGTGLGLAMVKQIVTEHGGTISVKNDLGAEFTVRFPINVSRGS